MPSAQTARDFMGINVRLTSSDYYYLPNAYFITEYCARDDLPRHYRRELVSYANFANKRRRDMSRALDVFATSINDCCTEVEIN